MYTHVWSLLTLFSYMLYTMDPVTSSLVQIPTHSCFQEDLTFVCSTNKPDNTEYLVNLVISVLHYPPIDTSRIIHSNAYTDSSAVYQNLTIQSVSLSEAPASVVCISIEWSNMTNTVISTSIESNASILVAPYPADVTILSLKVVTESGFKLAIQHNGVVHREDLLSYVIGISDPMSKLNYSVSYNDLPDEIFSVNNLFDTCYNIEINTTNCIGATIYYSTSLYLPKLRNETLTRLSLTEFCWYNEDASTICPGPYDVDFTQQNMFTFSLIRNNNIVANITGFSTMLPTEFCFFVPEEYLVFNPIYLRIHIEGVRLTIDDIAIPVDDVIPTLAANTIVIISASVASAIVIILLVLLLVVVVCVFSVIKTRR
ncbi:hypothetical protein LOD99_13518 [Oopsacas minuta]|uniref:Uncharacterized protein n=1 Tax=Oopsacas minuta TaxID=111878 RepID=A0AAV7KLN6_9METZ|nr:hypothetical protein LOD99_13518 [Oopsacas minuta]